MKIKFDSISFENIKALQETNTLYIMDYRAISESMEYEIPTMRKYENMLPRIVPHCFVTVNEDFSSINYHDTFSPIIVPKNGSAKDSIAVRLENINLPENIKQVYVPIPHPALDTYCIKNRLTLNYSYEKFRLLNNKLTQKKLINDLLTPARGILDNDSVFEENTFIKREEGSGGFTVFSSESIQIREDIPLYSDYQWYWEQKIIGDAMSVQILKDKDSYTVFGFCKQVMDGNFFIGGKILPLESMTKELADFVTSIINDLSGFLVSYEGFFGIDFILQKDTQRAFFLEANVRITAMTIPTLISNYRNNDKTMFQEDIPESKEPDGGIILTIDKHENNFDVLY